MSWRERMGVYGIDLVYMGGGVISLDDKLYMRLCYETSSKMKTKMRLVFLNGSTLIDKNEMS